MPRPCVRVDAANHGRTGLVQACVVAVDHKTINGDLVGSDVDRVVARRARGNGTRGDDRFHVGVGLGTIEAARETWQRSAW